jgi:TetR/AcrR family transcriptional regulator, cholesterol catabolism regulator
LPEHTTELLALLRAGESDRAIARSLGLNRRTVARYRRWADEIGLLSGATADAPAIPVHELSTGLLAQPRGRTSSVLRFRGEIADSLVAGLSIKAVHKLLVERYGDQISYGAVWRLARQLQQAGDHDTIPEKANTQPSSGPSSRRPTAQGRTSGSPASGSGGMPLSRGTDEPESNEPLVASRLADDGKVAERHAHLVKSATDLLLRRGFHRTTVRDIAAAAGWQIGTLYLYISRKEDILHLILDQITRSFLDELLQVERQTTARATLRAAAERYFRVVARMHRELRLLYRESASLEPKQRQFGIRRELAQRDVLADIIRWGVANGEFRPVHPDEVAHTIIMLAHMWGLKGWALIHQLSLDQFIEDQLALVFARLDRNSADEETALPHSGQLAWTQPRPLVPPATGQGKGIAAK